MKSSSRCSLLYCQSGMTRTSDIFRVAQLYTLISERLFVRLLVQHATDGNAVDRAADAGHRAESARRRGTCDPAERFYFEVISIYQRHLPHSAQADRQRSVHDNLATAHSVRLIVASTRKWLQQNRPQLCNRLGRQVDCYHFIAQRRGAE